MKSSCKKSMRVISPRQVFSCGSWLKIKPLGLRLFDLPVGYLPRGRIEVRADEDDFLARVLVFLVIFLFVDLRQRRVGGLVHLELEDVDAVSFPDHGVDSPVARPGFRLDVHA